MPLTSAAHSLTGHRSSNQDAWLARPDSGLFAVSDGMGGLASGEEASNRTIAWLDGARLITDPLRQGIREKCDPPRNLALLDAMENTFQQATADIYDISQERNESMGATLSVGIVAGDNLFIAHVGDTRIYLLRQGNLRLLTLDHSVAAERVRRGRMTREEYARSPLRSMLYQAIGTSPEVTPDLLELPLQHDDILILCSDGVWGALADSDFITLGAHDHLDTMAESLVKVAFEKGSNDNLTALVVRYRSDKEPLTAGVQWGALLQTTPLFSHLDAPARDRLAPFLQEIRCRIGDVVIREGLPGEELYVVLEGELEVTRQGVDLAVLQKGEHFGEIALVLDSPRMATVTAITECRLLVLHRTILDELIVRRPEIGALLLSRLLTQVAEELVEVSGRVVALEAALSAIEGA